MPEVRGQNKAVLKASVECHRKLRKLCLRTGSVKIVSSKDWSQMDLAIYHLCGKKFQTHSMWTFFWRCFVVWNRCSFHALFLISNGKLENCPSFTPPHSPSHKPRIMPKRIYSISPYNNLSLEKLNYFFKWIAMLCNKSSASFQASSIKTSSCWLIHEKKSTLFLPFRLFKIPGLLNS